MCSYSFLWFLFNKLCRVFSYCVLHLRLSWEFFSYHIEHEGFVIVLLFTSLNLGDMILVASESYMWDIYILWIHGTKAACINSYFNIISDWSEATCVWHLWSFFKCLWQVRYFSCLWGKEPQFCFLAFLRAVKN